MQPLSKNTWIKLLLVSDLTEAVKIEKFLKCPCRDVAAEVRAVEMDFFHGGVGGGLRGFQIFAQRRHA